MASQTNHPHILLIYDFGIDDDNTPYIVAEYASKGSLRDRIKRRSRGLDTPCP